MRALTPHVGAYVELPMGERLGVRRAALAAGRRRRRPGELDERDGAAAVRRVAAARWSCCEVQPPGKRPMDAEAWLRGYAAR